MGVFLVFDCAPEELLDARLLSEMPELLRCCPPKDNESRKFLRLAMGGSCGAPASSEVDDSKDIADVDLAPKGGREGPVVMRAAGAKAPLAWMNRGSLAVVVVCGLDLRAGTGGGGISDLSGSSPVFSLLGGGLWSKRGDLASSMGVAVA